MATPDLAGLLTRRTPTRATPPPPPAGPPEPRPPKPAQTRADPDRPEATVAQSLAAGTPPLRTRVYLQTITIYLPRTVATRLTEAAAAAGLTRTALLLQGVNATYTDIAGIVGIAGVDEAVQADVGEGDLFAVPQAQRVSKTPRLVQTTIRVTDAQLAGLNSLAAQTGISRSRVIAACLQLHLSTS